MLNEFAELRNSVAHNNDNFNSSSRSLKKENSLSEFNTNNNNNVDDGGDGGQLISWLDSLINLSQLFPNNKLSNYPHPIVSIRCTGFNTLLMLIFGFFVHLFTLFHLNKTRNIIIMTKIP